MRLHCRLARLLPRLFLFLVVPSLAALAADSPPSAGGKPAAADYIRFTPEGKDAGRLESAIVTFEGARGVRVHLVAAIHIADKAYYRELSRLFEGYDALLFEMVRPKDFEPDPAEKSQSMISVLQRGLKDVLGLEFQLDGIDYSKPNFIHADMDAETFSQMQVERGESLLTLMLRAVLDDFRRRSQGDARQEITPLELLRAFLSRDRARSLKLLLARQFNDLEARLSSLEGEKGTVILTERNKVAVEVLKKTIASGKKEIGLFYGGAHMPDLERRLGELGLRRKSIRWLVAWDLSPPQKSAENAPAESKDRR